MVPGTHEDRKPDCESMYSSTNYCYKIYCIYPNYSDRQVGANWFDQDQMPQKPSDQGPGDDTVYQSSSSFLDTPGSIMYMFKIITGQM